MSMGTVDEGTEQGQHVVYVVLNQALDVVIGNALAGDEVSDLRPMGGRTLLRPVAARVRGGHRRVRRRQIEHHRENLRELVQKCLEVYSAHPNQALLETPEAHLAINAARSVFTLMPSLVRSLPAMSTEGDLASKVRSWVQGSGLPFELAVGRTFRKAGFSVAHGSFYEDPQEQVPREIDVLARRMVRYREGGMLHVEVVLECKVSLDHPWVLFGQPDEPLGLHPTHRGIWNRYGQSWLQPMEAAVDTADAPLLLPDQFAAHAMAMAFGGDKDPGGQAQSKRPDRTFQAVTVAIKAARARAIASERTSGWGLRAVYFPVVALRGQLFDAHLDEDGEVVVRQVTHGQLLWHAPDDNPSGIRPVLVDIVTDEHLETFAADSARSADFLLSETDAALAADPTDIGIY